MLVFLNKTIFYKDRYITGFTQKQIQKMLFDESKQTYFRREILRSSAECFGRVSPSNVLLAKAEVRDLDVAVFVEEQIFKLKKKKLASSYSDHQNASVVFNKYFRTNSQIGLGYSSGVFQYLNSKLDTKSSRVLALTSK